jgi:broad specificity phosphatase PhoE
MQTWEILSEYIHTNDVIFSGDLREQWQGEFEWKPYNTPDFQRIKSHELLRDSLYDSLCREYHVESIQDFEQRIQSFFNTLLNQRKRILCITHGGVIQLYYPNKQISNAEIFPFPF